MIELNLNLPIKDITGKVLEGQTHAKLWANFLYTNGDPFPPIKARDMALKLYEHGKISIDDEDAAKLEAYAETANDGNGNRPLTFIKAALIETIREAIREAKARAAG